MQTIKINLLFLLLFFSYYTIAQRADILITNGRIIDGTGNSWFYGDVAISNGKIIYIGKSKSISATKTIDAKGMVITPGFIDVHTHIEGD